MDCISTAHPSWLTKEEIEGVGVPVQILAPEIDPVFTPELKVQIELYRRWDSTIIFNTSQLWSMGLLYGVTGRMKLS